MSVFGFSLVGLLDSGSSRTIVGPTGFEILKQMGLHLKTRRSECTVANGQVCYSIGYVTTPISLGDRVRLIDILVVPDLPHRLILGVDFWIAMNIIPDLRQRIWYFSECEPMLTLCNIVDTSSLDADQKLVLDWLLENNKKIMGTTLGRTHMVEHDIELLPGTKPIKQRHYAVSPAKQKLIDDEVKKMLDLGIIEPCKSPWSSPVCMVPKKDNTYRFCVDYRKLNACTKKDAYPIPLISGILDKLRDAKFISSLDIKSAYWQVPLAESSKDYTAFSVVGGLYRFCVMPFGLTNSPATWERLIDSVLGADLQPSVLVYLDDIVVVSQDFETHMETLQKVFDRLHLAGLKVNFDKCQFCRSELKYLGYIVDKFGLRPDPAKVEAILNIPAPKTVKEVRRFIGTASWYRRFVPNFSTIVAPLSNLTKKKVNWRWTPECEGSFKMLKEYLVTAPILTCPDFERTFYVQTDASAYGIGAVLTQNFDDGEKVICYLSRSLTSQERKYSSVERECISCIWAVEKLRHYLDGFHFKILTDCHSLLWLHNLKDPQGRLARWALRLQPYDYEIIHRKGSDHAVPDFLSRAVPISTDFVETSSVDIMVNNIQDDEILNDDTTDKWYLSMLERVKKSPLRYPLWRVQNDCQLYKYVRQRYSELADPSDPWKLVIPKEKRLEIINSSHCDPCSGHAGVFKTVARIGNTYYWPKLRADVAKVVKYCEVCISTKPEQKPVAGHMLSKTPTVDRPWSLISADLMGPLPRTSRGYAYILAVVDNFSKFVMLFPLRAATASSVSKAIEENIYLLFGAPSTLIVDNGTVFQSKLFKDLAKKYNVNIAYTANYHPQCNITERVNRVIKSMLSAYVSKNHRAWDEYLPKVGFAIRSAKHEVTGFTPNFINFGREVSLDGNCEKYVPTDSEFPKFDPENRKLAFVEIYRDVQAKLSKAYIKSKQYYDLRRRPDKFTLNQKVWRRAHAQSDATKYFSAKLAPKFIGPFTISKVLSPWTYELNDSASKGTVWHIKDLKAHPPDLD